MPLLDSGLMVRSEADLLALADRFLEKDYLDGLKAGEGYEIIRSLAKEFARVSTAIRATGDGLFAAYAHGGSFATGVVEFYRTNTLGPAVTVVAGTIVQASGGKLFRTIQDVTFTGGDLGPHIVAVRSIFQDYQSNTDGATTTSAGVEFPGEIDTVRTMIQDPPYADPGIRVRQMDPTVGGRSPMLDILAGSNSIRRYSGETDESLSYRVRNLPDNLTPGAIERMLTELLGPTDSRWELVESWETDLQTAYDLDDAEGVFAYDDPRPRYFPALDWYADDREQWGTFYVIVGKIQPMEDYGGAYDDEVTTFDELISPISGGRRAVPAYDMPDSDTFGEGADLGLCFDGRDMAQDALLDSVYEQMQSLRAAGIVAGLHQEGY